MEQKRSSHPFLPLENYSDTLFLKKWIIGGLLTILALLIISSYHFDFRYYFSFKPKLSINLLAASSVNSQSRSGLKIIPPKNGVYLGAYDWGDGVSVFEKIIGKKVAIAGFYKHSKFSISDGGTEGTMPSFDTSGHENAYQNGYHKFYVGIEYKIPSSTHSPQAVINGAMDSYIIKVAQDIKAWGRPIFWVYQREPESTPAWGYDGGGYGPQGNAKRRNPEKVDPWDYENYGCKTLGDQRCLDGWERSRDAARHIHDLVESITPKQVTWVANASAHCLTADRELENSYPGDDYVDWIAYDYYPCGQSPDCGLGEEGKALYFYESINKPNSYLNKFLTKARQVAPTKPVMLLEFGVIGNPNKNINRSAWFKDFFKALKTTHKQIKAFVYWQFSGKTNEKYVVLGGRIDSTHNADAKAWKEEIRANPNFWLSEIQTGHSSEISGEK